MKKILYSLIVCFVALCTTGCDDEPVEPIISPQFDWELTVNNNSIEEIELKYYNNTEVNSSDTVFVNIQAGDSLVVDYSNTASSSLTTDSWIWFVYYIKVNGIWSSKRMKKVYFETVNTLDFE